LCRINYLPVAGIKPARAGKPTVSSLPPVSRGAFNPRAFSYSALFGSGERTDAT
jgi:hypothetical protein